MCKTLWKMLALPQRPQNYMVEGKRMGFTAVPKEEQKLSKRGSSQGYRFKGVKRTSRLRKGFTGEVRERVGEWVNVRTIGRGQLPVPSQLPASSRAWRAPCAPSPAGQAARLPSSPPRPGSPLPFLTSEASKFLLCLKTGEKADSKEPQGGRPRRAVSSLAWACRQAAPPW